MKEVRRIPIPRLGAFFVIFGRDHAVIPFMVAVEKDGQFSDRGVYCTSFNTAISVVNFGQLRT